MKIKRFDEFVNTDKRFLLAPNGKPSNLNKLQWKHVRTSEFIEWFGDWLNNPKQASKIVDENGEPLVVYHGTLSDFNKFDLEHVGKNSDSGMWGKGFYFSSISNYASSYASRNDINGSVMSLFLNIRNPHIIKQPIDVFDIETPNETVEDMLIATETYSNMYRDEIISKGYDGVIAYSDEFVALYPNQIKSAIGNNGKFNKNNPNINEWIKDTWFEENPDFYLSKNKKEIDKFKDFIKSDRVKGELLYKEMKKLKVDDIKITFDGKNFKVEEPDYLDTCSFYTKSNSYVFMGLHIGREQNYKIMQAFIEFVDERMISIEKVDIQTVNEFYKNNNEYYSFYYKDNDIDENILFLTKDIDLYKQELYEIKDSDVCKIIAINNMVSGKEITDYETIEINKIKNKLLKLDYTDISFKSDETNIYYPIFNDEKLTEEIYNYNLFRKDMFHREELNTNRVYFGHLKNRFHVEGIDDTLRGIGIGYKLYKAFLKYLGYIVCDELASLEARNIYYKLLKDNDVYHIIDKDTVGKGSGFNKDPQKIMVIWKDNPKLEKIVKMVRSNELSNDRKYIYDEELLKYIK